MIFLWLLLIFLFSLLLVKATEILLVNIQSLTVRTKIRAFALSGLIVALGTSLPELFVGLTSAVKGTPSLALGNIIGANIANLSLIIGGAALLGGTVEVRGDFLKREVFYAFLLGAAPMVLLFDKELSRLDGIILLILYGFYQSMVFNKPKPEAEEKMSFFQKLIHRLNHRKNQREIGWIFLGIALMLFSAQMIVWLAKIIALLLKIPLFLVGLILISIGTCLPELAFELKAIRKSQPQMVFGNLLGSIAGNATFILGLVVLISPIKIASLVQYLISTMAFVVVFGAFYFFVRTKHRLEQWEGAFLIGFYLAFVLSEFIHP